MPKPRGSVPVVGSRRKMALPIRGDYVWPQEGYRARGKPAVGKALTVAACCAPEPTGSSMYGPTECGAPAPTATENSRLSWCFDDYQNSARQTVPLPSR